MNFTTELQNVFRDNASADNAAPMQAYMKNLFAYLGIRNENRKALLKPILQKYSDEIKHDFRQIVLELWQLPEREFHYCAMEILQKEIKRDLKIEDISLIETLLVTHSWWDSVDAIAKHVLGKYLEVFPDEIPLVIKRFSNSGNMWLNRSAILFQLGYKNKTNAGILFRECAKHGHSKEFFIRKAIGWALREYAKTNAEAVRKFVFETPLSPLSEREALKNL